MQLRVICRDVPDIRQCRIIRQYLGYPVISGIRQTISGTFAVVHKNSINKPNNTVTMTTVVNQ